MSGNDANLVHKESLMHEINALFAPPTAESLGKKILVGIPSVRRSRKANDKTESNAETSLNNEKLANVSAAHIGNSSKDDPFWKKPRANCHEYCDSCGCIEGERLVCDRCPASFHLECLDPPLEPDEAPISVWFCHRCSMILRDEEDKTSTSSSQTTIPNDAGSSRSNRLGGQTANRKPDNHPIFSSSGPNSASHHSGKRPHPSKSLILDTVYEGRSSRSAAWGESAYVADVEESDLRALWTVIRYASYQNPKEFELPKDLLPGIKLPGSYKTVAERKQKSIIELENGIIPRPVRRCYVCAKTCFFAPLLPCDYCSSCFHLECLDPPLPHFPPRSDRWMCPNHIEHIADRYLVRSIRLTERMRVWAKLADLNCVLPGPSSTTKSNDSAKLEDSQSVQDDDNESDLDEPEDKEDDDPEANNPVPPYELTYGPDEESIILADLMRMVQRGRAERSASSDAASSAAVETMLMTNRTKPSEPPRHMWRLSKDSTRNRLGTPSTESRQLRVVVPEAVKSMYRHRIRKIPRLVELQSDDQSTVSPKAEDKNVFVRGLLQFYLKNTLDSNNKDVTEREIHPAQEDLKEDRDDPVVPKIPNETPNNQDVEMKNVDLVTPTSDPINSSEFAEILKKKMIKLRDATNLVNLDPKLIYSLAFERIQQIMDTDSCMSQCERTTNLMSKSYSATKHPIRARAVFTPCDGTSGPTVCMRYRQFTIGTSPTCHLCLSEFKPSNVNHCRFVSSHHATIFFDDWTRHYELINYSEYGTRVDGITYGNDTTMKSIYMPKPTELVNRVRNLLDESGPLNLGTGIDSHSKSISDLHTSPTKRFMMMGPRHEDLDHLNSDCQCTSLDVGSGLSNQIGNRDNLDDRLYTKVQHSSIESDPIAGWEGPAVLRHGSVIEFGCYKFVLGLVDRGLVDSVSLSASSESCVESCPTNSSHPRTDPITEESHDAVEVCS